MDLSYEPQTWATNEFGDAPFDARNVSRLILMGTRTAEHPHAIVSEVFEAPHELQAAYDFLENPRIRPKAIVDTCVKATARRAARHKRVLIPCDGAELTLRDLQGLRGLGSVGSRTKGARGLQVMDAIALREDGVPLGLAALATWVRPLTPYARRPRFRPLDQRESRFWLQVRGSIRAAFVRDAPTTQRVFLHDGGADAWPVLVEVAAHDTLDEEITVIRAAHDRRASAAPGSPSHLWRLLKRAPKRWRMRATIPPGHGRKARRAHLEVRAQQVTLDVRKTPSATHQAVPLWALRVHEVGRIPRGEERLEWVLLTNWPLETLARAREVIGWYILRWRVEDHHKIWKRSGSDVERMQLRTVAAMTRWMAIHASVSARALALTHQARDPEAGARPASREFGASELKALRALRASRGMATPSRLTLAQAVVLVAILGGYMPARGRPPGPKILRRGLERLAVATQVVDALDPPPRPKNSRRK